MGRDEKQSGGKPVLVSSLEPEVDVTVWNGSDVKMQRRRQLKATLRRSKRSGTDPGVFPRREPVASFKVRPAVPLLFPVAVMGGYVWSPVLLATFSVVFSGLLQELRNKKLKGRLRTQQALSKEATRRLETSTLLLTEQEGSVPHVICFFL